MKSSKTTLIQESIRMLDAACHPQVAYTFQQLSMANQAIAQMRDNIVEAIQILKEIEKSQQPEPRKVPAVLSSYLRGEVGIGPPAPASIGVIIPDTTEDLELLQHGTVTPDTKCGHVISKRKKVTPPLARPRSALPHQ